MSIYDDLLQQLETDPGDSIVDEIRQIPEIAELRQVKDQNDLLEFTTEFTRPLIENPSGAFSSPVPTTITINGLLDGVNMMEERLIKYIDVGFGVACIECNFGHKFTEEYRPIYEAERAKRDERARVKQGKKKPGQKERKVQGDGSCFASQATFVDRKLVPAYCDGDTQEDYLVVKFFKIKVFRNGVLQIPGGKPGLLRYIMQSLDSICKLLTRVFNSREYITYQRERRYPALTVQEILPELPIGLVEPDDYVKPVAREPQLLPLIVDGMERTAEELIAAHRPVKVAMSKLLPVMIDYKFHCELRPGELVDLTTLLLIFTMERMRQESTLFIDSQLNVGAINREMDGFDYEDLAYALLDVMADIPKRSHPDIMDIKYSKTETKLSIMFHTPLLNKSAKKVRVNIFLGGWIVDGLYGVKIDILGALYRETTLAIYYYLQDIFERYWDYIIINPADIHPQCKVLSKLPNNVVIDYDPYVDQFMPAKLPEYTPPACLAQLVI